jgi:hypothetical protein
MITVVAPGSGSVWSHLRPYPTPQAPGEKRRRIGETQRGEMPSNVPPRRPAQRSVSVSSVCGMEMEMEWEWVCCARLCSFSQPPTHLATTAKTAFLVSSSSFVIPPRTRTDPYINSVKGTTFVLDYNRPPSSSFVPLGPTLTCNTPSQRSPLHLTSLTLPD